MAIAGDSCEMLSSPLNARNAPAYPVSRPMPVRCVEKTFGTAPSAAPRPACAIVATITLS